MQSAVRMMDSAGTSNRCTRIGLPGFEHHAEMPQISRFSNAGGAELLQAVPRSPLETCLAILPTLDEEDLLVLAAACEMERAQRDQQVEAL